MSTTFAISSYNKSTSLSEIISHNPNTPYKPWAKDSYQYELNQYYKEGEVYISGTFKDIVIDSIHKYWKRIDGIMGYPNGIIVEGLYVSYRYVDYGESFMEPIEEFDHKIHIHRYKIAKK